MVIIDNLKLTIKPMEWKMIL